MSNMLGSDIQIIMDVQRIKERIADLNCQLARQRDAKYTAFSSNNIVIILSEIIRLENELEIFEKTYGQTKAKKEVI